MPGAYSGSLIPHHIKNTVPSSTEKAASCAIHWAIILAALILTCFIAMFTLSAKAAECYTVDAFKADAAARGDRIASEAHYHGVNSDELVIIESTKGIIGVIFKGGCVVTAVPVDAYLVPVKPVEPGKTKDGTGA